MNYIIIGLMGGMAAILANRGIAVFNDALRPIMPENIEGRMDKKTLSATSFSLNFGLVIGFGIPFSIGAPILLVHSVLLFTDIIGTWAPKKPLIGIPVAGILGCIYAIGLLHGLQWIVDIFDKLPINVLGPLGKLGAPIIVTYPIFPALVVGMQWGYRKGALTALLTIIIRQLLTLSALGTFQIAETSVKLNPDGFALFAGMIIMLGFAMTDKQEKKGHNVQLLSIFSERVARVRKNIPLLMLMGGLVAAATAAGNLAGDPISLNLLKEGRSSEAALAALARAIGFIPLVGTTAIATGVYGPAGMTFVFVVAIAIGNPYLAFLVGAIVIGLEVMLLTLIAKGLDRFPGIKACGDSIRTAMTRVLEVSLLLGGILASEAMVADTKGAGLGYFWVIGFYVLNRIAKKPLVNIAVGPIAAILFGIIVNILYIAQLI